MPANLLPVPHHKQSEGEADCLAACVAMALDHLDQPMAREALADLLGTEEFGAPMGNVRRLARFGFRVQYGESSFDDLVHYISAGRPCIVAVATGELPYWDQATDHAVVVIGADRGFVYVNDPFFDDFPMRVPREDFMLAWSQKDYRLAVITR